MKRAETFWQAMVLILIALMTTGIYAILALAVHRLRGPSEAAGSAPPLSSEDAVQILEPLDGAVLHRSRTVPVRAALLEAGFVQAEVRVDGVAVALQVNPDPQAVPWIVQWLWEDVGEGSHLVTVRARKADGSEETSAPLWVTGVPVGRLIFASNRDGAYAIYSMQTDGRVLTRLTTGPGDAFQPAAGWDGALALVTEGAGGQGMVRRLEGDRGAATDLFAGRDPAWSPAGAQLAFAASPEGVSQVFAAALSAGALAQVTAEEVYAGQPTWSPDGMRLAYVAERERNLDIWIVALNDGEPRRLTSDPAKDWAPAWSPDGSRLAFVSGREGGYQIYTMRTDGSDVRRLTQFPRGAEAPAWSPDGYWLAFVAYVGDGAGVNAREIHLMRSDGQSQARLTYDSFDDTEPDWVRVP
jgi:Tol biopolymer transport system component